MSEISLKNIFIYPVKSLNGIQVNSCQVLSHGVKHDRNWLLIDEKATAITQRTYPQLAFVNVNLKEDHLIISERKDSINPISIPLSAQSNPVEVKVWDDKFMAQEINDEINRWFSDFLKKPVKLVNHSPDSTRVINQKYNTEPRKMAFQDSSPILIISQESLDDLNERLDVPVPMHRFRPNLVIQGLDPYREDTIQKLQIGSVVFRVFKKCDRCLFTTIDQETGKIGAEPLKTLSTYRKEPNGIMFGVSAFPENTGEINLASEVKILA